MFNKPTTSDCHQPAFQVTSIEKPLCTSGSFALEARALKLVRGRKIVLRDVHLAMSSGEMVALHGANGAGKTTLLQCLAGALQPTEGVILWLGKTLARSAADRGLVGFLGHENGLYLALTVWENLLFAGRMYRLDHVAERTERMLTAVGLQQHRGQQAGCLSRGQRQRLAIARAVIHDPPILLLDEPFTSLDSNNRNWLEKFLGKLRGNGGAILVASHEVEKSIFDRVMVLQGGRLHALNETEDQPNHRFSCVWRW